jgi:hypothetical protein
MPGDRRHARPRLALGLLAVGWFLLSAGPAPAAPVGWDSDDFIISGGGELCGFY